MIQVHAKENRCIDLGRRGEDRAREVLFDISGFAELYGQGEAKLVVSRYKDFNTYSATITQDNTTVSWVVTSVDTNNPGFGSCELVYITDGSIVKSTRYQTHVDVSLSDPVGNPAPPDTTYGELLKLIKSVAESIPSFDDAEQISILVESDMLSAVHDVSGAILTDENNNVILRY